MNNFKELETIYNEVKRELDLLMTNNSLNEKNLQYLISAFYFGNSFDIFEDESYNITSISNLFRFYEENIKISFKENRILFDLQFKAYLLLLELFSRLCKKLTQDKNRRVFVKPILRLLTESKNMIKLFIPFNEKELNIINNLIGQQLYSFTHSQSIDFNDKSIDYLLEYYLHSCEKIIDGYRLSISTNFGNSGLKKNYLEMIKVKNNLTFLLLCMYYKIYFYFPKTNFEENNNFIEIFIYLKDTELFKDNNFLNEINNFKLFLIKEFKKSSEILILNNKKSYYEEKISLLSFDTDEYKELIDIISGLK